ncbi:GTPase domain-containing protein [Planctomicrobium piriforme]|uniref:50S ribosome-binding GTPase n=1 Tax=Planctomicrobium piriforme TaxID=1576369 RepID=A0A1I3IA39_9PLAN|nr:GTPase domain-containing protein [Planctomicrobium piriforme]SFI44643.1 50S ribosome-binding GTPase [Planctomicrobium piriforme]
MPPANASAALIDQLAAAVEALDTAAGSLLLPPLEGREWHELLTRKLQPQLGSHPFLVVAVVGGTNIGKSVIFNHLAGGRVSATSPTASGTKHPTALISPDLLPHVNLGALFPGFSVVPWERPEQPLQEDPRHRLYYRTTDRTPENLVILDTPDVDSVAVVNWERAAHLRQSADVLIAVLTQQKYNDAAIKEFFRRAAHEGKLVIAIFNQCLLPEDETYWPLWLQTFCTETGVSPDLVYLAPNDRRAAESNTLPFYERDWPLSPDEAADPSNAPHELLADLSQLKFDEIKQRALSGALRHVSDPQVGIPAWLREIDRRSTEFADALALLSADRLAEIERWPTLPNSVLIAQVREWWRNQREGWSASVHGLYNRLGQFVALPVKLIRQQTSTPTESPIEFYRQQEWQAALDVLERCLDRLERIRDLGNPLLKEQIARLLTGVSRADVIAQLKAAHESVDFNAEVQRLVDTQLHTFRQERPDFYRLLRRIDTAAAAVRPAISVALFVTGAGPFGDAIVPVVAESALQGAFHLAGEAVGGTVVTAVGDKVITEGASSSAGYLEARFRQLHTTFAQQRAEWMSHQLNRLLLRDLPGELVRAAEVRNSPEYQSVRKLVQELQRTIT